MYKNAPILTVKLARKKQLQVKQYALLQDFSVAKF